MPGVLVAPELADGESEEHWRQHQQIYGLLSNQPDWRVDVHLGGGLQVDGSFLAAGQVQLGDEPTDPISITGTAAFGGPATFYSHVTVGDDPSDTLTVRSSSSFLGPLVAASVHVSGTLQVAGAATLASLTVAGAVALGDANDDTQVSIGTWTHRATGGQVQMRLDAANNRSVFGSATPLAADITPAVHVVGRLYVAPESANDHALSIRRSSAAASGWWVGLTADVGGDLVFKDDGDATVVRMGAAGSAYQLDVTGDARVSGVLSAAGMSVTADGLSVTGGLFLDTDGMLLLAEGVSTSTGTRTLASWLRVTINGTAGYLGFYT